MASGPRPVRAPRSPSDTCKGWVQEAALRMLMNNLDPEVAEDPDRSRGLRRLRQGGAELAGVRYHRGRAAQLENDETLLVQSGKPVGVIRTHDMAPRVLIANSLLVPKWATWEEFRRLEAMGLTMFGQMTAGSWIYIGTQGILQGTYETFAALRPPALRRQPRGPARRVTAGLGGMGGAQPLAATMNGAAFLGVDVNPRAHRAPPQTGYLDRTATISTKRSAWSTGSEAARQPLSVGLLGNAAAVHAGIGAARRRARCADRSDIGSRYAQRLCSAGALARRGLGPLRRDHPQEYVRAVDGVDRRARAGDAGSASSGAVTFDYGNNMRAQAVEAGVADAFRIPGFIPEYIRPLFCEGNGPFRWVALSGDPEDIYRTDRGRPRDVSAR